MNRRGFMQAILAAGVAPYVQTAAGVLMPVRNIISIQDEPPFSIPGIDNNLYRWVAEEKLEKYLYAGWEQLAQPWTFKGMKILYIPKALT